MAATSCAVHHASLAGCQISGLHLMMLPSIAGCALDGTAKYVDNRQPVAIQRTSWKRLYTSVSQNLAVYHLEKPAWDQIVNTYMILHSQINGSNYYVQSSTVKSEHCTVVAKCNSY